MQIINLNPVMFAVDPLNTDLCIEKKIWSNEENPNCKKF